MADIRTYTPQDKTMHRLIRAALKKKLMCVKITWHPRQPFQRDGWYLTALHHENLFLGYDVSEAEQRINRI